MTVLAICVKGTSPRCARVSRPRTLPDRRRGRKPRAEQARVELFFAIQLRHTECAYYFEGTLLVT